MIISPSLLGYEETLEQSIENIKAMIAAGIQWLHIDVMRPDFIPGRTAFSDEKIYQLYSLFGDAVNFDFHLMVSNPKEVVGTIESLVPQERRESTFITIHREAYRPGIVDEKYVPKEYDLLAFRPSQPLSNRLAAQNESTEGLVYKQMMSIKDAGFKVGLALEPGTILNNVTPEMSELMDMILLMSVHSGKGGQSYITDVTGKILLASQYGKDIQVDGGINQSTLPSVIGAGATNIVIGSYITKADDVGAKVTEIMHYVRHA